jgi:hypothetical protein
MRLSTPDSPHSLTEAGTRGNHGRPLQLTCPASPRRPIPTTYMMLSTPTATSYLSTFGMAPPTSRARKVVFGSGEHLPFHNIEIMSLIVHRPPPDTDFWTPGYCEVRFRSGRVYKIHLRLFCGQSSDSIQSPVRPEIDLPAELVRAN